MAELNSSEPDRLKALTELQEMIAKELDASTEDEKSRRALQPLTEGLGLLSPRKKPELPESAPKLTEAKEEPGNREVRRVETNKVTEQANPKREGDSKPTSLALLLDSASSKEKKTTPVEKRPSSEQKSPEDQSPSTYPPPMPRPSFFRRFLSAIVDEVFVLTVWCFALMITMKLLNSPGVMNALVAGEISEQTRLLLRFGILEFVTIWLGYFAFCIGVLDMTFGMWVWGIRVGYGRERGEAVFLKKGLRILWSFILCAPVLPSLLLIFRRRGRNLLDLLSGTVLYRSAV